jgi:Zn-dependent M16 (insulinase) family peptidase
VYLDHILYPTITDSGFDTEVVVAFVLMITRRHRCITSLQQVKMLVLSTVKCKEEKTPPLVSSGESNLTSFVTNTHDYSLRMLQAIYPGDCGYKSETGGIMANLRDLTVHKGMLQHCVCLLIFRAVRSYHKSYYRPDNLCLIITGIVDPQQLFEVVAKYEDERILSKEAYPPMQR